jgi:molybdate transport system substrate-binding protein
MTTNEPKPSSAPRARVVSRVAAAFAVSALALISSVVVPEAAELRFLVANGVRGAITEIGRDFEKATSHELVTHYEVVDVLKRRIDGGEAFDVAILRPEVVDALIKEGKVAAQTKTGFARTGLGAAVRKGAPRPDISTSDALRRVLLSAKAVGYAREGGSGTFVLAALEKLGIAAEMKPRLKAFSGSTTVRSVITGEVDIVLSGLGPILSEPGAELVGSLPDELQTYIAFALGISTATRNPEASEYLVRFVTAPNAMPVLKSHGLELYR